MIIVKIGGGESLNLEGIVGDLAALEDPVIIVHGANALRDRIMSDMGMTKQVITSVSGYASVFTDEDVMTAILMTYSGLRNKRLVELCQQNGINAIGLCGIDGRVVEGTRNRGIRVVESGRKMIRRDFSGKPRRINASLLDTLLSRGYTPVLTIPICDERGYAVNSENDDIVCALHDAMQAHTVIQLIEAPGLLEDASRPETLISTMEVEELCRKEAAASGRIKRKLHAIRKLLDGPGAGTRVIVADGRTGHPVRDALSGSGTLIGQT